MRLELGPWLASVAISTVLAGLVYVGVQQSYRQSANDPQIQLAEDSAAALQSGQTPAQVVPATTVLADRSLAPFLITFDDQGEAVAASVKLGDVIPKPPQGVFGFTHLHHEDRFTWQPRSDVRIAAVLVRYDHGYVLAGRNLREVEIRETRLSQFVGAAWGLLLTGLTAMFLRRSKA